MSILQAFIYIYRFILDSGNLDLYYGFALVLLVSAINKKSNIPKKSLFMVIPLIIIGFFPAIFSPYFTSLQKMILFILKMFLNFIIFFYVKEYFYKFDLIKFIKLTSNIMFILTIMSLLVNKSIFWRLNDIHNDFSKERLELIYLEPSILSMSVSILIIFIFYYILIKKADKGLIISGLQLIIMLILSAGLNGIMCLVISLGCMLIIDYISYLKKNKISVTSTLIIVIAGVVIVALVNYNSNIMNRIIAVLNGKDGSSIYRYTLANEALKQILSSTNFMGLGLGNMNTEKSLILLNLLNMEKIFANSFMYFIAEAGILGAIYIVTLVCNNFKNCMDSNKLYKIPLFIFIILYQIAGGYFTDPLIWIIYGVIASSKIRMNSEKSKKVKILI